MILVRNSQVVVKNMHEYNPEGFPYEYSLCFESESVF